MNKEDITTIQVSKQLRDELKAFLDEHGSKKDTHETMIRKYFEAYKRKR